MSNKQGWQISGNGLAGGASVCLVAAAVAVGYEGLNKISWAAPTSNHGNGDCGGGSSFSPPVPLYPAFPNKKVTTVILARTLRRIDAQ